MAQVLQYEIAHQGPCGKCGETEVTRPGLNHCLVLGVRIAPHQQAGQERRNPSGLAMLSLVGGLRSGEREEEEVVFDPAPWACHRDASPRPDFPFTPPRSLARCLARCPRSANVSLIPVSTSISRSASPMPPAATVFFGRSVSGG